MSHCVEIFLVSIKFRASLNVICIFSLPHSLSCCLFPFLVLPFSLLSIFLSRSPSFASITRTINSFYIQKFHIFIILRELCVLQNRVLNQLKQISSQSISNGNNFYNTGSQVALSTFPMYFDKKYTRFMIQLSFHQKQHANIAVLRRSSVFILYQFNS